MDILGAETLLLRHRLYILFLADICRCGTTGQPLVRLQTQLAAGQGKDFVSREPIRRALHGDACGATAEKTRLRQMLVHASQWRPRPTAPDRFPARLSLEGDELLVFAFWADDVPHRSPTLLLLLQAADGCLVQTGITWMPGNATRNILPLVSNYAKDWRYRQAPSFSFGLRD